MCFVLHYIWHDINDNFRSKTKVFDGKIKDINDTIIISNITNINNLSDIDIKYIINYKIMNN